MHPNPPASRNWGRRSDVFEGASARKHEGKKKVLPFAQSARKFSPSSARQPSVMEMGQPLSSLTAAVLVLLPRCRRFLFSRAAVL